DYVRKVFILFPRILSFDTLYNNTLEYMDYFAKKITNFYMTGFLKHYFMYIFLFFIFFLFGIFIYFFLFSFFFLYVYFINVFLSLFVILGGTFIYLYVFSFSIQNDQPIDAFLWMLAVMIITAGIVVLFAKSRLTAILINGFIGYLIAMLFVLLRAPDLALTQIVVETVTTALFLLCFYFLPDWKLFTIVRYNKVYNDHI